MILGHTRLFRWCIKNDFESGQCFAWVYENGADYDMWRLGPFDTEQEALLAALKLAKDKSFDNYIYELELLVKEIDKCDAMYAE